MKGITLEGVPLKKHLEEEHSADIQKTYNDELKERSRARGRVSRKDQRPVKEGVSKRVRRLRDHEIRKEYGLMQRRHTKEEGGIGADCLWLIRYKSPMTANDAAVILEHKKSTVSSIFTQLWRALGDKYLKRGVTLPYEYTPLEEFDPIFVYDIVRKYYAGKSKEQRERARGKVPEPPKQEQGELALLSDSVDVKIIYEQLEKIRDNQKQNNVAIGSLRQNLKLTMDKVSVNHQALSVHADALKERQQVTPINVGGEIKELNFAIGGMMEIRVIFTSS